MSTALSHLRPHGKFFFKSFFACAKCFHCRNCVLCELGRRGERADSPSPLPHFDRSGRKLGCFSEKSFEDFVYVTFICFLKIRSKSSTI